MREGLGVRDRAAGGGGGGQQQQQRRSRDILIPSMGMGRSLLSDRHGISVQFSCRKITWSGVICITEPDLVTQHYPRPPARPPPRQSPAQTHTHTELWRTCCLAYVKQQISKLTFPTVPALFSVLARDVLKAARKRSGTEKMLHQCMLLLLLFQCVHVCVSVCVCFAYVCGQRDQHCSFCC